MDYFLSVEELEEILGYQPTNAMIVNLEFVNMIIYNACGWNVRTSKQKECFKKAVYEQLLHFIAINGEVDGYFDVEWATPSSYKIGNISMTAPQDNKQNMLTLNHLSPKVNLILRACGLDYRGLGNPCKRWCF